MINSQIRLCLTTGTIFRVNPKTFVFVKMLMLNIRDPVPLSISGMLNMLLQDSRWYHQGPKKRKKLSEAGHNMAF